MKRLLLAFCVLFSCTFLAASPFCFAQKAAINGVLASERVINLPQDEGKWYISVVGNQSDARYTEVLGWFDTNLSLKKLKDQVHFCPIEITTVIYKERYESNVKGLPTVRLQDSQGGVRYESCGVNLPFTADGLYSALANGVNKTQRGYILPYRQNQSRPRPIPQPDPNPDGTPDVKPDGDPAPQPLDNKAKPDVPEVAPLVTLPPLWLMLGVLFVSAGIGILGEWKAVSKSKV